MEFHSFLQNHLILEMHAWNSVPRFFYEVCFRRSASGSMELNSDILWRLAGHYIPFLASRTTSISRGFHTFLPYLLFYRNRSKLKQNGNIRKNFWNWSRGNSLIWVPNREGIVKFSVNSYTSIHPPFFHYTLTVQNSS